MLASSLRPGLDAREFTATRFFDGLKLHKFRSGAIWIVKVELPFAVAKLRFLGWLKAVRNHPLLRNVNVFHPQRLEFVAADGSDRRSPRRRPTVQGSLWRTDSFSCLKLRAACVL
jgi:hypothetical protein